MEWIIESSIAISILFGLYGLLFKKDSFFQLKRFYLLAAGLFSTLLPFIELSTESAVPSTIILNPVSSNIQQGITATQNTSLSIIIMIWITGVIISAAILLYKGYRLRKFIKANNNLAFSFFNIIKTGEAKDEGEKNLIYFHEKVHSRQLHSLDLLIIELLKVIMWFNPLVHFLAKELKFVHENIADSLTIRCFPEYKKVLLNRKFNTDQFTLIHEFNPKINFKTRMIMMTKKSKKSALIKYLSIPVTMGLLFLTFCLQPTKSLAQEVVKKPDEHASYEKGMDVFNKELGEAIKYPEDLKKAKEEGTVYISMLIGKEGEVIQFVVLDSNNPKFNEHALKAVKSIKGKWKPGIKDNKPVRTQMVLPVKYKLDS